MIEIEKYYRGDLGPVLKQISDMMDGNLNNSLKNTGITSSQARLLVTLRFSEDGSLTQRELENIFMVSHPTMVGLIKRLRGKGLVELSDRDGNSSKRVMITDEGRKVTEGIYGRIREMESALMAGFTDDERNTVSELLLRMHSNMSRERGRDADA